MALRHSEPWISLSRVHELVQVEPALLIIAFAAGTWLIYKFLLRRISEERHKNLRGLFKNLMLYLVAGSAFLLSYLSLSTISTDNDTVGRLCAYLGLLTILFGCIAVIKTAKIVTFEYLFLGHMKVGVPVLIVHIFTLILSLIAGAWFATAVFNIQLAPILATSAIFSVILGLALQDTLGNLFSGLSLQVDKPYEIGDWIEVQNGAQKWVGQVHELSWRATILIALGEEIITIPNRIMAQSQIANYTARRQPIIRSQIFRISYETPIEPVRALMLNVAGQLPEIKKTPAPLVLIIESAESWLTFKLIYFIDDYGAQLVIGDKVITAIAKALNKVGFKLASPAIKVQST